MSKNKAGKPFVFEINKVEDTVVLDFTTICVVPSPVSSSAIDDYYQHSQSLLKASFHPEFSVEPTLIRLLLLGLVSAAEFYFRSVLAGVVEFCPFSRAEAHEQTLSLGAVDYYSKTQLGYALLEHRSFSTKGEVKAQTKKLTGIDIPNNSSVAAAIELYDSVCHLRHAAVHSRGELNAKNARDLGLELNTTRSLKLSSLEFQKLLAACHNAVRAYNRFLYGAIVERWIVSGLLSGVWASDKARFSRLFSLFVSRHDAVAPRNVYIAYQKLVPQIRKAISLREGGEIGE